MSTDISAQFRTEGQPAFPVTDTENDNSADSPSGEETTVEETQSDEGEGNSDENKDPNGQDKERGFADDPRWKEREDDWKKRFNDQESRHVQEIAKLREEIEGKLAGKTEAKGPEGKTGEVPTQPSWFGGTPEQWAEFVEWNKTLANEAQEGAVKKIQGREQEEQKRIEEATKYFNDEVAHIESDKDINPQGIKVDRNKLLKAAQDFDLVDSKGRWNYRAAWRFIQNATSKPKDDALDQKRKIAGATVAGKGGDRGGSGGEKFVTNEFFKKPGNRPW